LTIKYELSNTCYAYGFSRVIKCDYRIINNPDRKSFHYSNSIEYKIFQWIIGGRSKGHLITSTNIPQQTRMPVADQNQFNASTGWL
jgi:hypothetical protein